MIDQRPHSTRRQIVVLANNSLNIASDAIY
jgi:hypothetical protein